MASSSSPVRLKDRKFDLCDFELTTTLGRVLYLYLFVVRTVLVIKVLMKHTQTCRVQMYLVNLPHPTFSVVAWWGFLLFAGTGTFGRVILAREKNDGNFYALKVMSVADIIRLKQVEHVQNEKRILIKVENPFVVNL